MLVRAVSTACRSSEWKTPADTRRRAKISSQAPRKRTPDRVRSSGDRDTVDRGDANRPCSSCPGQHGRIDPKARRGAIAFEGTTVMDATKGLKSLLATLEAQKSRGWTAHNELDYFRPCPTCGHWFDCRNPENLPQTHACPDGQHRRHDHHADVQRRDQRPEHRASKSEFTVEHPGRGCRTCFPKPPRVGEAIVPPIHPRWRESNTS